MPPVFRHDHHVHMSPDTTYTTAAVADFRANLGAHLRSVRAGGEVLILDRGRPVARLVPVGGSEAREGRMEELIRAGQVRPPEGSLPRDFWDRPRLEDPEGRMVQAILEERAEGP